MMVSVHVFMSSFMLLLFLLATSDTQAQSLSTNDFQILLEALQTQRDAEVSFLKWALGGIAVGTASIVGALWVALKRAIDLNLGLQEKIYRSQMSHLKEYTLVSNSLAEVLESQTKQLKALTGAVEKGRVPE